jgi:hypothetical protein
MPRSYIVFQSIETTATTVSANDADVTTSASLTDSRTSRTAVGIARQSTKDAGRVHIGAGMMRFHATKDAGRVHIGAGMMRF